MRGTVGRVPAVPVDVKCVSGCWTGTLVEIEANELPGYSVRLSGLWVKNDRGHGGACGLVVMNGFSGVRW